MPTIKEQCEAIWRGTIEQTCVINIWWLNDIGFMSIDWEAYCENDD